MNGADGEVDSPDKVGIFGQELTVENGGRRKNLHTRPGKSPSRPGKDNRDAGTQMGRTKVKEMVDESRLFGMGGEGSAELCCDIHGRE